MSDQQNEYKAKNLLVYVVRTVDGKSAGGGTVAEVSHTQGPDMAERIAACLNALEGVPTKAIVKNREDIQDHARFLGEVCVDAPAPSLSQERS